MFRVHSAQNVQRHIINLLLNKNVCIKLVNYSDYTEMHGQQNIKIRVHYNSHRKRQRYIFAS